jgi:hypothetical protein
MMAGERPKMMPKVYVGNKSRSPRWKERKAYLQDIDNLLCDQHDPDYGHKEAHDASRQATRWVIPPITEDEHQGGQGHTTEACDDHYHDLVSHSIYSKALVIIRTKVRPTNQTTLCSRTLAQERTG